MGCDQYLINRDNFGEVFRNGHAGEKPTSVFKKEVCVLHLEISCKNPLLTLMFRTGPINFSFGLHAVRTWLPAIVKACAFGEDPILSC